MRVMVTVRIEVPPERRGELPALLERENRYVAEQLALGALEAIYYADETPPTIWAVLRAESLDDAQRQVERYPMYPFMRLTYTALR